MLAAFDWPEIIRELIVLFVVIDPVGTLPVFLYATVGVPPRYEQFIQETVHWTFWPSLALALLMLVVGKYFLMLFGPDFVEEGCPSSGY